MCSIEELHNLQYVSAPLPKYPTDLINVGENETVHDSGNWSLWSCRWLPVTPPHPLLYAFKKWSKRRMKQEVNEKLTMMQVNRRLSNNTKVKPWMALKEHTD